MDFRFSDDQRLFQSAVRDLLAKECTPAHVRAAWEHDGGLVPGLWDKLAAMGVVGLLRGEEHGGLGGDLTDLVLILEEAGRAALPGPLLEAAAVVAPCVSDAGDAITTVWFRDEPYAIGAAAAAGVLVVDGVRTGAPPRAAWYDRDEVTVAAADSVDLGRRPAAITVAGAGRAVDGAAAAGTFARAALGASAQLVGLADAMIALAGSYATEREQFGKPIGSFQAVKHHLSNALLKTEFARPAVYRAAHSMATAAPTAGRDVAMAKVMASDAALFATRVALQIHGAIGYTWEHDLHLWMKPAWALAAQYGDAAYHRGVVALAAGIARG